MQLRRLWTPLFIAFIVGTIAYSENVVRPHPHDNRIHIVYWEKWTGFEGDAIKQVVHYYNTHQNKIHVDLLTISGIENKTLLAVAGGDPPDLAGLYGPNVTQYADDKAVLPLTPFLEKYGINRSQYIPAFWDEGSANGQQYALPTTPASTALFYNRAMFKAAGMDPDKPRDWHNGNYTIEEMDKDAERLSKRSPSGQLEVAGFLPSEPGWWNWGWGYFFGGRLWDGADRITATDPGNIEAYRWIQHFTKEFGTTNLSSFKSGLGQFSSPQNGFMSGKVAMEIQGVWMYHYINMFSPQMCGKDPQFGVAPFPFPAARPDLKGSTFSDEDVITIPRGARHPDAAFQFVRFLESPKGMDMLCGLQWKMSPLIKNEPGFYRTNKNPLARFFAQQAMGKNTIPPPKMAIWPQYENSLSNSYDEVSLLTKTPTQALEEVQREMQPQLLQWRQQELLRARAEANH